MPSEPKTPVEVKSPKSPGLLAAPAETGRTRDASGVVVSVLPVAIQN